MVIRRQETHSQLLSLCLFSWCFRPIPFLWKSDCYYWALVGKCTPPIPSIHGEPKHFGPELMISTFMASYLLRLHCLLVQTHPSISFFLQNLSRTGIEFWLKTVFRLILLLPSLSQKSTSRMYVWRLEKFEKWFSEHYFVKNCLKLFHFSEQRL